MLRRAFASTVALPLLLAACQSPAAISGGQTGHETLTVADPWSRPGLASGSSAAYMRIENASAREDRLLSATTDAAGVTMIHETRTEGGVSQMVHLPEGASVPAAGELVLAPGGIHVMMMDLKHDLAVGDAVSLTLTFATAGEIEVEAPVREPSDG